MISSCATIFNNSTTDVKIISKQPAKLIVGEDTLSEISNTKKITVLRDFKPLKLILYNDSISKTVNVKSKMAAESYVNLLNPYVGWVGLIIDFETKRGYTFPSLIYVDLEDTSKTVMNTVPINNPYMQLKNKFSFTPLKLVDLINPAIELAYERKTGAFFATQFAASFLLPGDLSAKGYRFGIEERYYFKTNSTDKLYAGFEFDYLNSTYHTIWDFGIQNIYNDSTYNNTNYPDTFGIKKQNYTFNSKLGYQLFFKRFFIDLYGGLGLRHKNVKHFDRIRPQDAMEAPRHPNFFYGSNFEGKYWTISIPLNLKIGWLF